MIDDARIFGCCTTVMLLFVLYLLLFDELILLASVGRQLY